MKLKTNPIEIKISCIIHILGNMYSYYTFESVLYDPHGMNVLLINLFVACRLPNVSHVFVRNTCPVHLISRIKGLFLVLWMRPVQNISHAIDMSKAMIMCSTTTISEVGCLYSFYDLEIMFFVS